VIIDPEVKGKVSVSFLKPVYWKEALNKILEPRGYTFTEEGETVRILPKVKEPINLYFIHLKYADVKDVASKLVKLLSKKSVSISVEDSNTGKEEEEFSLNSQGKKINSRESRTESRAEDKEKDINSSKKSRKMESFKFRQNTTSSKKESNNYKGSVKLSKKLSEKKEETIVPDEKTNTLILKVRESTYLEVKKIVKILDVPPKDTYVIELKYITPEKAMESLSSLGKVEEQTITIKRWDATKSEYVDEKGVIYTITLTTNKNALPETLTIDTRTNKIIYKGSPAGYERIVRLLKEIDKPRKRIRVKAKIVQVESTFEKDLGVSWGATGYNYPSYYLEGSSGFNTKNLPGLVSSSSNLANVFNIPTVDSTLALGILNKSKTLRLSVALKALQLDGKAKIVSSPEILTLDNEQATITQGIEIPYIKTTSTSAGVTNNVEFRQASLILSVKPHITPDGQVLLDLEVRKDSPNYTITQITGNPNPAIDTRSARAKVRVKNGDTIVIGGIYEKQINENLSGVPVLSQIPLLGWLFKSKTTSISTKKLLIFITPEIIE